MHEKALSDEPESSVGASSSGVTDVRAACGASSERDAVGERGARLRRPAQCHAGAERTAVLKRAQAQDKTCLGPKQNLLGTLGTPSGRSAAARAVGGESRRERGAAALAGMAWTPSPRANPAGRSPVRRCLPMKDSESGSSSGWATCAQATSQTWAGGAGKALEGAWHGVDLRDPAPPHAFGPAARPRGRRSKVFGRLCASIKIRLGEQVGAPGWSYTDRTRKEPTARARRWGSSRSRTRSRTARRGWSSWRRS